VNPFSKKGFSAKVAERGTARRPFLQVAADSVGNDLRVVPSSSDLGGEPKKGIHDLGGNCDSQARRESFAGEFCLDTLPTAQKRQGSSVGNRSGWYVWRVLVKEPGTP